MIRRNVEGRTSNAFCGGLTGRRWAPADPIRRRSDRDRNDDMGGDGCPRALDLRGVVGCDQRRAVSAAVRHWGGGAGRWVAGWVAGAGARVLRGGPDRVRSVPGGEGGGDRLSGDRAIEDAASVGGSQQVRPPRHRSAVASADGRRADTGRGPVSHVRGGEGPGQGTRAGAHGSDALPAQAVEAVAASRPRVGPHRVDAGAPPVALSADLRASEHRAGVHRQPRRLRRADGPPASARRAALPGRDRPGVLAGRPPAARVPRLDTLSALIIVLEVADFTRFPRAVQLGSWLGLVPSREQSGETDRHGSITKTGSKYARRILVEAAWHYARSPGSDGRCTSANRGCPTTSCRSRCAPSTACTASTDGCANARSPGNCSE